LGLALVIVTMVAGLALVLILMFLGLGLLPGGRLLLALVGLLAESLILLGFTLVFSMITKPLLVVCFSVGIFLIGHWQGSLQFFAGKADGGSLVPISWAVRHFLPNLERLNWLDLVLYNQDLELPAKFLSLGYALAWFVLCICVSALIFKRKDVG
jgi:hypothetical protein